MNETQPVARYIARHNGYYPANPLEAFHCDFISNMCEPVINACSKWVSLLGGEKKAHYKKIVTEIIPGALKKVEKYF